MVEAGWYYDPGEDGPDGVTCPYCSISVEGWEAGDDPLEEHRRRAENAQNNCLFFTLKELYHPANIPFTGADAPAAKAKGKGKRASSKARSSTTSNISATGKKAAPKAKTTKASRAKTTKSKKRESAMTETTDVTEMTAVTDNTQLDFESDEHPVAKGGIAKKTALAPSEFGSDDLPLEPQPAKGRATKKAPASEFGSDDLVEPVVAKPKGKKKAAAKPAPPLPDIESDDAPPPVKGRATKKLAPMAVPLPEFSSDDLPLPTKTKIVKKKAPSVADSEDMMALPPVAVKSKRTRKGAATAPEEVVAPPKRKLTKKALADLDVHEQIVKQPPAKSRPVTRKSLATDTSTDDAPKPKQPAKRGRPPKRASEHTELVLDSSLIEQIAPVKIPAKRGRPPKRPSEASELVVENSVVEEQKDTIVKQPAKRGRPPKRPSEATEVTIERSFLEEREQSVAKAPAKHGRPPKRLSEPSILEPSLIEDHVLVKQPAKRGRPPQRPSEATELAVDSSAFDDSVLADQSIVKQPTKRGRPPKRLSTQSQSEVDASQAEPEVAPESAPESAREPSPETAPVPSKTSKAKTAKTTKRKSDQTENQEAPARRTSKRLRPSDVEPVNDTLPDTLPTFSMPEEALHQSTPPHVFRTTPPRKFSPPIAASVKKAHVVSTSTPLRQATVRTSTPPNATANAGGMKTPDVTTPASFHHANKPHWSPIDIERFFEKENLPAIDIKDLTSPEKRMTVEQFLMHEAARQEKVLRDQMLRQIDTLDVAYNRALAVVDEMEEI